MKRIFNAGLLILVFIVVAGIVITINTRKLNHYYDKTVEIGREDSLSLKATDVWLNRGYLFLNDSICIWGSKLNEPNLKIMYIYELGLPLYFKKSAKSDTLWISNNKVVYYFIFKKDIW